MSTRSVIARATSKGFVGVYHHWDGYPEGLGSYLFDLYQANYKGDIRRMAEDLIDAHPAGWSNLMSSECFCHGRDNEAWEVTQDNAADSGCEWAYVFDEGPVLVVLSSVYQDGSKMIGMFGSGDPNAIWAEVARIPLDGEAPAWETVGGNHGLYNMPGEA